MLPREDQRALFQLARDAMRAHLLNEPPPELPGGGPQLGEVRGVFVTLRRGGRLRGCIGHTVGRLPLAEGVRTLAVSAAFQDHRFQPLQLSEMSDLELELTVLSPLSPADPAAIAIGTHGLMIRCRGRSGLLLPQVAGERGWDAETFLAQTCRKAGLPAEAWRDPDAELSWFTGAIYHEDRI